MMDDEIERPSYYDDITEIIPYEDYDQSKAKYRASILWLLAKANDDGRIPTELRDPFYRDNTGHDLLKPWITQRLANGELYGRALANIYGVPDYSSLSHQNILHLLTRRSAYNDQLALTEIGEPITETMLLMNSPVKLAAHMVIIECIMILYTREILIPIKVAEVVSRFSGDEQLLEDAYLPDTSEPEDVAVFWVNRATHQLNQEIMQNESIQQQQVPSLDELSDMCDGCSLLALLAFYCPKFVDWREICIKQDISIGESNYNIQRIQFHCQELFEADVCFLSVEDFLYLPESMVPNFLVFIADLLYLFEIQPVDAVTPPHLRLFPHLYNEDFQQQPTFPQLPTPSEMRAKSLKHQSWNDPSELNQSDQSTFPANHQLYDHRTFNRTSSNMNLSHGGSSRRNSLSGNERRASLNRRSSLLSNGSENQATILNHHHHHHDYHQELDYQHTAPDYENESNMVHDSNNVELTSYLSSLSISNNNNNSEYFKNRSRDSKGQLTDYFSSLSNINHSGRGTTHVRAKITHPNNMDNVKSLLVQENSNCNFINQQVECQTTSSDTSSVAEMSEYSDLLRIQLSEKRKQIESERQQERAKRASSDHNFRQEVFKTLKNINSPVDQNPIIQPTLSPQLKDEENLTFEIHELNPIRRESTFTSISSTFNRNSTFARKNLFSASEDLKASMTDLNYSNATKPDSSSSILTDSDSLLKCSSKVVDNSESSKLVDSSQDNSSSKLNEQLEKKLVEQMESSPVVALQPMQAPPQPTPVPQLPTVAPPSKRSQWGQPIVPLQHYQASPTWSQTPQPPATYGGPIPIDWPYQVSPYHHHHLPHQQPFPPYPPYANMTPAIQPMRPYSMSVMESAYAAQYPAQIPPTILQQQDPSYMSIGPLPSQVLEAASQPPQPTVNSPETQQQQVDSAKCNENLLDENKRNVERNAVATESFFISFKDERSLNSKNNVKAPKSENKKSLSRSSTQTFTVNSVIKQNGATEKENDEEERIKELYNVRRLSNPIPAVSYVISGDDQNDQINGTNDCVHHTIDSSDSAIEQNSQQQLNFNEEEMTKKKEAIMKQSLKRRAFQEVKRQQKEQELAVKRESEQLKREQMERKKEQDRAKRAFILEQYKQRKQMEEEIEKNGGMPAVTKSSSTLVLNRTPAACNQQQQQQQQVTMRPQRLFSSGKPRPKSLHVTLHSSSAAMGLDASSHLTSAKLSSSRDEIDLVGRFSSSSSSTRPQSALSSQVTTPTAIFGDQSFLAEHFLNSAGPVSNNFYNTEYNGPKLFVKPSQKSNKALILNAINAVLAGAVNAETNRRVTEVINCCDSKYYLILFRNSGLQYRAIYSYNPEREEVSKLDGIGPRSVNNEMIDKFYKYNSGTKSFTSIQTKHLCVTIDAFTIHNHLWMSKAKQQQFQMTPRRFDKI